MSSRGEFCMQHGEVIGPGPQQGVVRIAMPVSLMLVRLAVSRSIVQPRKARGLVVVLIPMRMDMHTRRGDIGMIETVLGEHVPRNHECMGRRQQDR
ncbi:MAG: hypothetical protein GC168_19490 [Candidatus Hydrogenedens sp.]|nr:hypothetical protein [Candidatus Hydrogenedens sp.]